MKTKLILSGLFTCTLIFTTSAQNSIYPTTGPGPGNTAVTPSTSSFVAGQVYNTYLGWSAGAANSGGSQNTFLGAFAGNASSTGENVAIGSGSFQYGGGSRNIAIGMNTAEGATGSESIYIGRNCGKYVTGGGNCFFGALSAQNGLANIPSTLANTIILADGNGNQRITVASSTGYVGIGLNPNFYSLATNRLEINSIGSYQGTPGLRFRGYGNNKFTPTASSNRLVLTINNDGDVILVDDQVGTGTGTGITNNCGTNNFVPLVNGSGASLTCSQIFDNSGTTPIASATVGINSSGPFTYSTPSNFINGAILPPNSGTFRLDVNGVTRSLAYFAFSDKKFKKDIKAIDGALESVMALGGKTYFWNADANKQMNFDSGLHSGVIAQELEKVLPHLVATGSDGSKSVNYIELIPYLIEAIKTQQTQIDDLRSQLTDNFKKENTELISLQNTKIISVSPNPSSSQILVSLNIEKSVTSAKLQIHDLDGNIVGSFNIAERDNNISKTLLKDNYGKGIYVVSLVVNGKSIDTKKIVFN